MPDFKPGDKVLIWESVESLRSILAFNVRDWSQDSGDAWIYGIVIGWKAALLEVAKKHGWSVETVERLRKLHLEFSRLAKRPTGKDKTK